MRIPRTPPEIDELAMKAIKTPDHFQRIMAVPLPEKYLHWDKLKYHKGPDGLSAEEWWLRIKMHRNSLFEAVPLKDKNGKEFKFFEPKSISEQLHYIAMNTGGMISGGESVVNEQTRDQYYIKSLLHEAITSSQLEGAVTTTDVAKEMIRTRRRPRDKSERMILNNYHTMHRITEMVKNKLTPELVFDIHRAITIDTLEQPDAAGRFRRADEEIKITGDYDRIVYHDPPHASRRQIGPLTHQSHTGERKPRSASS